MADEDQVRKALQGALQAGQAEVVDEAVVPVSGGTDVEDHGHFAALAMQEQILDERIVER